MERIYSLGLPKVALALLSLTSISAFSQNNYVATTPNSATTGTNNTIVGVGAGSSITGAQVNTFLGYQAGNLTTTGIANVFLGSQAGLNNTTGKGNMFLGQQAGGSNTSGNYNLFVGNSSGSVTSTGSGNTAIGDGSLLQNSTGTQNTAIGQYAGVGSSGSENVFIGSLADVSSSGLNLTNATAIGARARVSQSNSIVLGANANVGIGTSAPANKLEITAGTANRSGLRFTNLTRSSSSLLDLSITLANPIVKVLTVDTNGDVVLAGLGVNLGSIIGGRVGAPDTWTVDTQTSTVQSVNNNPVSIGGGIKRMPTGYKLFVAGGILTEKVKVAVKDSDEWADYVFADNYKLRNLNEVSRFVQKNKHLPGVPSASEVAANGIDLGKMDAKLLEKIEELTLYVIELKKENQQIKKAMRSLSQNKRK
ncbi:TMF family protein [Spirosoma agri]|uniref:TMF family protein n=1 Tax=Spirosoma agri TaxID=1987381 RepID=A0A6M0IS77_9BACT|nr:TMF family protein [Spirosoma agri]NEU70974.1 TMF family protein [Spirosoma agri]